MELDYSEGEEKKKKIVFERGNEDAAHQYLISCLARGAIEKVRIYSYFDQFYCQIYGGLCSIWWDKRSSSSTAIARVELMRALISTAPNSLRDLCLYGQREVFTEEELCELFQGIASNSCTSLTRFEIDMHSLAAAATPAAATTTTIKKRTSLSEALATNRTIEKLRIVNYPSMYDNAEGSDQGEGSFAELLNPWHGLLSSLRSRDCRIQRLTVTLEGFVEASSPAIPFLERDLKGLADVLSTNHNQSIEWLSIVGTLGLLKNGRLTFYQKVSLPEELLGLLEKNSRLTILGLGGFDLGRVGGFDGIFHSLASNFSLRSLALGSCEGSYSIASILDGLQSNGRISDVDYSHTPLDRDRPAIQAQLARNKANAERMEVLYRDATTVRPTRCRLFLCGSPYAGKSTLAQSMKDVCKRRTCMTCMPSCGKQLSSRTQGIEMSKLARGGITVSLWDMAGQHEYHAIHDFMFPDLSSRTSPSFFLFVWNPVHVDGQGQPLQRDVNKKLMFKTPEDFQQELRYWLKFITSKTRRSNNFKPVLLVVITRKDCCDYSTETWISRGLNDLRNQFEQYADIHNEVFDVDARMASSSMSHLTDCVFEIAEKVLGSADDVLNICEHVLASISQRLSNKSIHPLVTKQKFLVLCKHMFPTIESDHVEAIALSLHDFGDLIYMHSIDFVVVDTQWFSHTVMGRLLHVSEDNADHVQAAEPGFVPVKHLERLLENQMRAEPKKSFFNFKKERPQGALADSHKELMKLLQGLRLACLEQDDGDFIQEGCNMFVPAMLPLAESDRLKWRRNDGEQFLGRRLRCRDSDHTFLTPGIFPLIQVNLHRLFSQNSVVLQRSAVGFMCEGVEVWVQLAEDEGGFNCIDTLVKSVKDHDSTLLWVEERVITVIQRICASDKGIQGVTLEEMVIRPACVRNLGISRERRSQCVAIEQLRNGLQDKLTTESFADSFKEAGFDWPSGGDGLGAEFCRYIDLLGEKTVLEICEPYAENWRAAAMHTLGITEIQMEGDEEGESEPESGDLAGMYKMLKKLLMYARDTNVKVTEMQGQLQRMQRSVDVLRDQVLKGMSAILMFHKEMEAGRYPWMFVVTEARELNARRLITAMVPGLHDWKLELVCENPDGKAHLPPGQPGLSFATMENGLLKDALPHFNTFLQFACAAVGAGAHAATGFAIPDFSGIVNLPTLINDQPAPVTNTSRYPSRDAVTEAQQWLWNTLAKHGCNSSAEIYNKFKLQRVRRSNSCVVWVCDEHRGIGTPC